VIEVNGPADEISAADATPVPKMSEQAMIAATTQLNNFGR
jgi:hypothetical protein